MRQPQSETLTGKRSDAAAPLSRFVVGIDLGTTNIAVSYVDLEGDYRLRQFNIPQLTNLGEIDTNALLPAALYLPGKHELPKGSLELPWDGSPTHAVGVFARQQGAAVPERLVSSAKSWLAHAGVDRTRGILPWGSELGDQMVSPVQVSTFYLEHIRNAWDAEFARLNDAQGTPCILREQQVILTVPASFDEVARQLTLSASQEAGLEHVVLLEEPLAAFYGWLWAQQGNWQEKLPEGSTVLIVDVGGGTTDFSLIRVEEGGTLRRTAVGDHLLLGGDNMDMSLARQAEAAWGVRLGLREWSMLCQECRKAKEALFSPPAPDTFEIGIAGLGSSVIASTRTIRFERKVILKMVMDGFFPMLPTDSPPPERGRGIRQMGLPYAADPAVTGHLLQFLKAANQSRTGTSNLPLKPAFVLFNGGAMLPDCIRTQLTAIVGKWGGGDVPTRQLEVADLKAAVSTGAACYGLARHGIGVRVKGGTARAYYLEAGTEGSSKLVCVMPRNTEEGVICHLTTPVFRLRANQPVEFRGYASATRLGDALGDLLEDRLEISPLPSLRTVLRYGKKEHTELTVTLSTVLNEVGTLDIWCTTADDSHRYPLSFHLRGSGESSSPGNMEQLIDQETVEAARELIREAFANAEQLKYITRELERTLSLPRQDWGITLCRSLADSLTANPESRTHTARHEARWLNLTGFLTRPGFGVPSDEWRMGQLWKLWHGGPGHPKDPQVAAEWWIFWRRVAGGLRSGQQQQIAASLIKELIPKSGGKLGPRKRGIQEATEMWRCLGALERLVGKTKLRILRTLVMAEQRLQGHHFWVIARVGARQLIHGPADAVVPAGKLEPLLTQLFRVVEQSGFERLGLLAVANLTRLSKVRNLDVKEEQRAQARELLASGRAPEEWRALLDHLDQETVAYRQEVMGEALPLGLMIGEAD